MRITLDTVHDSPETIKKAISLLNSVVNPNYRTNYQSHNSGINANNYHQRQTDFFGNNNLNSQKSSEHPDYVDLFSANTSQKNISPNSSDLIIQDSSRESNLFVENSSSSRNASSENSATSIFSMFNSDNSDKAMPASSSISQNSTYDLPAGNNSEDDSLRSKSASDIIDAVDYFEELDSANSVQNYEPQQNEARSNFNSSSGSTSFNEIFANLSAQNIQQKKEPRIEPYN